MQKKWLVGVAAVAAGAFVAGLVWISQSDSGVDARELSEAELREYMDEVVGVRDIILDFRQDSLAVFRSDEDQRTYDEEELRWLRGEATGEEVERWWYVASLELAMIEVDRHLDRTLPELFLPDGTLYTAYYEAMGLCASDHGHPGLMLTSPPPDEYERLKAQHGRGFLVGYRDRLQTDFGITLDEFFDIRHECAKTAQTYLTLEEAERDRILDLRYGEYWQAIETVILGEPDLVVPRLDPSQCSATYLPECAEANAR